jgi:hypothetical protein
MALVSAVTLSAQVPAGGGGGKATPVLGCAGSPGNTIGKYRQQCQTAAGAIWSCNNAAGCTVSADWVAAAGAGGGATIPATTDLIKGDGSGNGADSKVAVTSPATLATINFFADNETITLLNGTEVVSGGALGTPSSGNASNLTNFPATVVQTNQSNTYSTGTQDFTSATATKVSTKSAGDNTTAAASTAFVTTAVNNAIAGVNPAVAVLAASTANITGTYTPVASGIGDTFTVTATGAFTLDGIAINTIGQRVLLKDQSTGFQNGVYTATVVGVSLVSPVFTRALDYDQPSDINSTGAIPVQSGTANVSTSWLLTSTVNAVGTDALTYVKFSLNPSNLVIAVSPGVGLCHFAGSTQTCTSSAVSLTADVSGVLPTANVAVALANQTSINGVTVPSAVGDATVAQVIAHGATAMTTGALAGNTCASATTVGATGVATTDIIAFTPNADISGAVGYGILSTDGLKIYPYPTSGNVNFKVCNGTSSSITVPAMTLNWKVIR